MRTSALETSASHAAGTAARLADVARARSARARLAGLTRRIAAADRKSREQLLHIGTFALFTVMLPRGPRFFEELGNMFTLVALVFEYRHYSYLPLQVSSFRQSSASTPSSAHYRTPADKLQDASPKSPISIQMGVILQRPREDRATWQTRAGGGQNLLDISRSVLYDYRTVITELRSEGPQGVVLSETCGRGSVCVLQKEVP